MVRPSRARDLLSCTSPSLVSFPRSDYFRCSSSYLCRIPDLSAKNIPPPDVIGSPMSESEDMSTIVQSGAFRDNALHSEPRTSENVEAVQLNSVHGEESMLPPRLIFQARI